MGGNIFSARGLHTPRMPPVIYHHMVQGSQAALRKLFRVVCTPVDGPAKADFGDVDILVADPLEHALGASKVAAGDAEMRAASEEGVPAVWGQIIDALGAKHKILKLHDSSAHLALPWPRLMDGSGSDEGQKEHDTFVQLDVRICASERVLRWMAFRHAHGDIWNILGSMIRPLGLTADETALWLRIPEVEVIDRKRARVLLTDDPHVALDVLGLPDDKGQWDNSFDSYEDLFEYVAGCRFFYVSPDPSGAEAGGDAQDSPQRQKLLQELDAHGRPSSTVHGDTRQTLKSNDRRRMKTRPLFRAWIDEFIPRCRAAGLYPPPPPDDASTASTATKEDLRDVVRAELLARFPAAALEYDERLTAWRKERQRLALVEAVKAAVPAEDCERLPGYDNSRGRSRSALIAALRRVVLDDDGDGDGPDAGERGRLLGGFAPRRNRDGLWLVEDAAAFVAGRWRDAAPLAWEANQRRIAETVRRRDLERKAQYGGPAAAAAAASYSDDAPRREEQPVAKKQKLP
ncbi:hypothetical protein RB595_009245 [Gaeumannomyces hyphopodioides]